MIGADALLKSLENQGVKQIFAYPGGAVLPIYDRMPTYGIKRILTRHEQGAAFAAAGYSRATTEVGVCLATSGPGATNLVTGIADAYMDSVPMVAITGNVFGHLIGTDAFQEIDIIGVCEPIVKHSYFVENADDLPRIISEAFHLALSGRPGPVLIDIPKSVQIEEVDEEVWKNIELNNNFEHNLPGYDLTTILDLSDIDLATDIITEAQRPVVILGHGVCLSQAETALKQFLETTQIPTTWTLHGIGCFPYNHELALGMLGMHGTATANFAVANADCIIGIGIRFDDRITGIPAEFEKRKKIIHLDIDPAEFGKNVKIDAKLAGQINETLPKLTESLSRKIAQNRTKEWREKLQIKLKKWPLDTDKDQKLTEIGVLNKLYKIIDQEAIVTVDVGQHEMWAAQRFPGLAARKFLASGGLGTMGFSLPSAMGAAFAGYETWSVSGDGGIQMNIQEFATLVQDNIPVKIIILNNSFLGMVRQWQELFYDKNYVDTPMHNPDFQKVGEAYGIPSYKATTHEEAEMVLQKMKKHTGPVLCEFVVEKEENLFPMVPAGKHLSETLLNPTDKIDTL